MRDGFRKLPYRAGRAAIVLLSFLLIGCSGPGPKKVVEIAPDPPQNVRITQAEGVVLLAWDCEPDVTHYTVFWGTKRHLYRNLADTSACEVTLARFRKGTTYFVAVTAWNRQGESDYSTETGFVYDDDPTRAPHYLAEGGRLMQTGNLKDAEMYLSAAIRLDPTNASGYQLRARLFESTNRLDQAEDDHKTAEQILKEKRLSRK